MFHCRYMQRRDQLASNGDPKQLQLSVDRTTTHAVKPQQSLVVLGLSGFLDNTHQILNNRDCPLDFASIFPTDFLYSDFKTFFTKEL